MGRNAQTGVGRLHRIDFQRRKAAQGCQQLIADIAAFHAGQAAQRRYRAFQQPGGLLQAGELGQARGFIAGLGTEITGQLGHFGNRADGRLGRRSRCARRKNNFRTLRKSGRIPGQGRHSGQRHAQGKIFEDQAHALPFEGGEQFLQNRVVATVRVNGRRLRAFAVRPAAGVPLHQFAQALQKGFLGAVARRGAVEFAEQLEPVQGQPDRAPAQQMGGRVELPGRQVQHTPGLFRGKPVVYGAEHGFQRQQSVAETGFGFAPGGPDHVRALLPEAEKGETLHKLHQGRRLRLFRRGSLAHLLAGGHDLAGVRAADAEIDRNAQTAHVHSAGFRQNVQIHGGQALPHMGDGLGRADGLVQILGVALGARGQSDDRQGFAHGRSRIRML